MSGLNGSCHLAERFPLVLDKITQDNFKITDDSFLDKLLSMFKVEMDKSSGQATAGVFIDKLEPIIKLWNQTSPDPSIAAFILRFMGTIAKSEMNFQVLQQKNIIDKTLESLADLIFASSSMKTAYIALLQDLVNHSSGLAWIIKTKAFKDVVKLCLTDNSIYVQRDGKNFILKLMLVNTQDKDASQEVQQDLLFPLVTSIPRTGPLVLHDHEEEKLLKRVGPSLQLVNSLLVACMSSSEMPTPCAALAHFEVEPLLRVLLESCELDTLLDQAVASYVSICIVGLTRNQKEGQGEAFDQVPECIMEVLKLLLRRHKVWSVLELCKLCQALWNKIHQERGPNFHLFTPTVEIHFIIIQMIPVMMFIKKTSRVNYYLELYLKKLSDMTTDETIRVIYSFRDVIQGEAGCCPMQLALRGVLSLTKKVQALSKDMAVLIFQGLMYVLKEFTPNACDEDEQLEEAEVEQLLLRVVSSAPLLSAILNALCELISHFNITWTESFESLCVLKFSSILLKNVHLSPVLAVQTLRLAKLTIVHYLPPNLALLVNTIEGSSFECLAPLLYKRLHDPNWEIRDSCLELVTVIAEQAEIKYPAFQQMLIDIKICDLLASIVEGDSESYVRASALRALSAMVKSSLLWGDHLSTLDLPAKIAHILTSESEGIVRREATWLAKQMYEHQRCRPETMEETYKLMGSAAICDLHWEVKVNALCFWEQVINQFIADEGMIDGAFPSVTFSKAHRKIVALTGTEIRHRLQKVLRQLSSTGCLHVLLTALNDDCDYQVVQTAARIITDLLALLVRYEVIQPVENQVSTSDKKRRTSDEGCREKRQHVEEAETTAAAVQTGETGETDPSTHPDADRIIEDIVSEMDINLLVSVCAKGEQETQRRQGQVALQLLQPQVFLDKVQCINLNSLLEEKARWLQDSHCDLNTLLDDMLFMPSTLSCNTNSMDCY